MKKILILLVCLLSQNKLMAVDEYILPDATNFVDLRHVKRATCTVLYFDPAHIEYKEGGGPGIGGSNQISGITSFIGGQIGGYLGGFPGGQIGGLIGQGVGLSLGSTGTGFKPPSPIFYEDSMRLLGTGVVFSEDKDNYFVLTAGHAVDRKPYIQFNYAGERSVIIPANIAIKQIDGTDDICVLYFPKEQLGSYPKPTIMPLSTSLDDDKLKDVVVMRFGSITHTNMKNKGEIFQISAKIHKGISGSPIVDKTGKKLLGIVLQMDGTCIGYKRITTLIEEHNKNIK